MLLVENANAFGVITTMKKCMVDSSKKERDIAASQALYIMADGNNEVYIILDTHGNFFNAVVNETAALKEAQAVGSACDVYFLERSIGWNLHSERWQ